MRIGYFEAKDTLYIKFCRSDITETCDLDESILLELDAARHVCALTFEHASEITDIEHVTLEDLATCCAA